jgi:hypothetical protein
MKRLLIPLLFAGLAVGCSGDALTGTDGLAPNFVVAQAANTVNTNTIIDVTGLTRFNVCTSETIVAAGNIHIQFHVTDTGEGIQISGHANLANLSAIGQDTGNKYRLVGSSSASFGLQVLTPGGAEVVHFVLHQRWVAQGPGNDRAFESGSHFTVNANGELVAFHLFSEPATCQ